MRKLFYLLFVALMLVVPTTALAADKEPVHIYLFHGSTCPHCQELLEWFDTQEEEYGDMYDLYKYEVWEDEKNAELLELTGNYLGSEITGVPFMMIGEETFSGFSPELDSDRIIETIKTEYEKDPSDRINVVDEVIKENNWKHDEDEKEKSNKLTDFLIGVSAIVIIVGVIALIVKARED